jgi:hypothetical protein
VAIGTPAEIDTVKRRRVSLLGDRQIQVAADDGPEIQLEVYGCSAM